ncbi:hypothetical protein CC80DRAFT_553714 [Byssothecium circinans]|uniref:Uncharacterized protein n=1 Tax=Byssothecium circinans TaxID=147558 RepID=A0A6A5TH13_9PLEO|nr:hypothetical protein CC80DRAFT_553714 [Byssothecium circinans]
MTITTLPLFGKPKPTTYPTPARPAPKPRHAHTQALHGFFKPNSPNPIRKSQISRPQALLSVRSALSPILEDPSSPVPRALKAFLRPNPPHLVKDTQISRAQVIRSSKSKLPPIAENPSSPVHRTLRDFFRPSAPRPIRKTQISRPRVSLSFESALSPIIENPSSPVPTPSPMTGSTALAMPAYVSRWSASTVDTTAQLLPQGTPICSVFPIQYYLPHVSTDCTDVYTTDDWVAYDMREPDEEAETEALILDDVDLPFIDEESFSYYPKATASGAEAEADGAWEGEVGENEEEWVLGGELKRVKVVEEEKSVEVVEKKKKKKTLVKKKAGYVFWLEKKIGALMKKMKKLRLKE